MYPRRILEEKLLHLLAEDVGQGDVTTSAVVPSKCKAEANVIAKSDGVVAGIEETVTLAEALGLNVDCFVDDGVKIKENQVLIKLTGKAATILTAERTMLNLLSRMSGIATATRTLNEKINKAKLKTRIAATRKSAPGLLYFDKKAVIIGGGDPHRLHLDDMILIKDNHIAVAGNITEAVKRARQNASFSKKIEVEVTTAEDALKVAELGVDIVMLDNFSPQEIKELMKHWKKKGFCGIMTEASGGITSKNILEFAATGVDVISMGELTHSVEALDISLEIVKTV